MVQSYWIGDFKKSRKRGHFLELSSTQPFPGNFAVFQTVWNGYRFNEYKRRCVIYPSSERVPELRTTRQFGFIDQNPLRNQALINHRTPARESHQKWFERDQGRCPIKERAAVTKYISMRILRAQIDREEDSCRENRRYGEEMWNRRNIFAHYRVQLPFTCVPSHAGSIAIFYVTLL